MMSLFNLFKKKEKEPEKSLYHFYGVIVTDKPETVNSFYVRSFAYSIKNDLFKNMPFIFLDFNLVREYIKARLLKNGGYGKLYFYHIDFCPLNKEDEEKIKVICDENINIIDINEFDDFDVAIVDDYNINESVAKIMPGIETLDEFYHCLAIGYDDFLNKYLKPKYYERFSESKEIEPLIQMGLKMFKLEFVIAIFDDYYKKDDNWEKEFKEEFNKTILLMNGIRQ